MEDVKFDPDEGIITKDGLDFPLDFSKKIDFEQYLQEQFIQPAIPPDDDMEDLFDAWLEQLDVQELIDFGQQYAEKISLIR